MTDQDISDLLTLLDSRFVRFSRRAALRREHEPGAIELSYADLRERIAARARVLESMGVGSGGRVALLCENRPAWVISFLAALQAGAVVVPLDIKLGTGELVALLRHARPRLVLASHGHAARAHEVAARLAGPVPVVSIEGDDSHDGGEISEVMTRLSSDPCVSLARAEDEPALVIYTSGTTGEPKGVTISFGNLLHQVKAVDHVIGPQGRERFLSILPLCHLYELICGLLVPLTRGATISYPATESLLPAELTRIMRQRKITSLVGVPLLYRALARGIAVELRRASRLARAYVAAASALAAALPITWLRRLLHRPVLARMGGSLAQLYSGGAPLDVEVARTFLTMGLPILQGYGLSETSPVIATNTARAHRLGSVGRPLPGVDVKLERGEIWARGANVMTGYLDRPDLTAQMIDADGWLHTGDLGRLDADGYLYITGRAKDLIVLGGGKKVHPDEVEAVLAASPRFAEVCVLGMPARQGHDEVCAVVVPAPAADDASDATVDPEAEIARMLADVAAFKRPTRVVVRREPIPRTTTRKAKRAALAAWIHQLDEAA
ncbi:MAG: AMP-binding protein [Deltaproteobacteria bacterium]|nr:AMP-binding protein [Kofleriaceae bacterium]